MYHHFTRTWGGVLLSLCVEKSTRRMWRSLLV